MGRKSLLMHCRERGIENKNTVTSFRVLYRYARSNNVVTGYAVYISGLAVNVIWDDRQKSIVHLHSLEILL